MMEKSSGTGMALRDPDRELQMPSTHRERGVGLKDLSPQCRSLLFLSAVHVFSYVLFYLQREESVQTLPKV
jgi:hypothetical protein